MVSTSIFGYSVENCEDQEFVFDMNPIRRCAVHFGLQSGLVDHFLSVGETPAVGTWLADWTDPSEATA